MDDKERGTNCSVRLRFSISALEYDGRLYMFKFLSYFFHSIVTTKFMNTIGSTHELQGLDKVNGVINAQYSELKDNLGELSTYYKQFNDQGKYNVLNKDFGS